MKVYELSENNSGGSWWLNRAQYEALHKAGWYYAPYYDDSTCLTNLDEPFLGGDAPYGWRHRTRVEAESLQAAVESFEAATGEDFFAQGCNCCGVPFSITAIGEDGYPDYGEYVSGHDARLETVRPF